MDGVVDTNPVLDVLISTHELERCIESFVGVDIDGIGVFYPDGRRYLLVTHETAPMQAWPSLPVPARLEGRRVQRRKLRYEGRELQVYAVFAGPSRVGTLIVSSDVLSEHAAQISEGIFNVVATILRAGYSRWVTSELHRATSERAERTMVRRRVELERAIVHLREADQLKSRFLANVSHELRTPLTSVIGFSEMLLEGLAGPINAEQHEFIETIRDRGQELLDLISRILEMSSIDSGTTELSLAATPIMSVVDAAIAAAQAQAAEAKVEVRSKTRSPKTVLVDTEAVSRILGNVLDNAIKFSPVGSVIEIDAVSAPICRPFVEADRFGEEPLQAVRITVRDHGPGIPHDKIERIFDAFYQADAGSTRSHGGAGIGLTIARNLVLAHGGEVWAESEVGCGCEVHFTLPLTSIAAHTTQ